MMNSSDYKDKTLAPFQEEGQPTPKHTVHLLYFSPQRIALLFLAATVILLAGNLLSIYLVVSGKHNLSLIAWYTSWYLDFNNEANIPAFFSTMLLMFAAVLNVVLYFHYTKTHSRIKHYWLALAAVFLFLSLDENVQFHEAISQHLTPRLSTDLNGFIYWSWVVPYTFFVLVIGFYFLPFVKNLPSATKKLFLLSGLVFISGALGLEFFEGYFYKLYGLDHIINKSLYCIEELCEMSGVTLFIYALMKHISRLGINISLSGKDL